MAYILFCSIEVSEFELQLRYYIYFRINIRGKGMNSLMPPALGWKKPLLFFYKVGFDFK